MKALTLWQPWASLVALGVKTIETRSWSTSYRGPLAIHAAKTTRGIDDLPGDCEGNEERGWRYGYIGDFQASYCFRTSDEGTRGETQLVDLRPGEGAPIRPAPLGAVVATCRLIEVVPTSDIREVFSLRKAERRSDVGRRWDVTPQLSYGDYSPGRYAWLLADIKAVDPPVPATGRQGLFEVEL